MIFVMRLLRVELHPGEVVRVDHSRTGLEIAAGTGG